MAPIDAAETLPYCGGERLRVLAHVLNQRAQVLEIEEQQPVVVRDLEDEREHRGLRVVQVEQAGQEQRPHLGDGRARRVTGFAEDVPEHDGRAGELEILQAELRGALGYLRQVAAGHGDSREIALHVGEKDRHADPRQALCQHLQRHGLARARRTGDQAMAVRHLRQQQELVLALGDEDRFGHRRCLLRTRRSPARAETGSRRGCSACR